MRKKTTSILLLILFVIFLLIFIISCTGTYNTSNSEIYLIEESDGELDEDTVQGNSFTIATNEEIDQSNGDIEEERIVGTDIDLLAEENENNSENLQEDNDLQDEEIDNNKEEIIDDTIEEDDTVIINDDDGEVNDEENMTDESFIDDIQHKEHNDNDKDEPIEQEDKDEQPVKVEPIPIKSSLGQIFTLSSEDNKINYLFMQLIPKTGMSTVEIGKDALGMLLNSINLIENAKDRIGKVDYVVVGVEMSSNDVWYFIASVGDLKGYLNGMLDRDQLLDRIEIKKGLPNVFNN